MSYRRKEMRVCHTRTSFMKMMLLCQKNRGSNWLERQQGNVMVLHLRLLFGLSFFPLQALLSLGWTAVVKGETRESLSDLLLKYSPEEKWAFALDRSKRVKRHCEEEERPGFRNSFHISCWSYILADQAKIYLNKKGQNGVMCEKRTLVTFCCLRMLQKKMLCMWKKGEWM